MTKRKQKKRALALAGGGPAAGLHIGALAALEDAGIRFDIFSLSCVGAWVGIVYNTRPGQNRAEQTYRFFEEHCFRDDDSFEWFPMNRGFAADVRGLWNAWLTFGREQPDWSKLFLPQAFGESVHRTLSLLARGQPLTDQDLNYWTLNDFLAVNPWTRYLTSLVYKSEVKGLSRVYYDDSRVLADVFQNQKTLPPGPPEIYHNAWRMPKPGEEVGELQIFHNSRARSKGGKRYLPITWESLCACSALPYIEESIQIGNDTYTEGALVDTVNFANLLHDHPDLDEIWVNRIVDESQVRPARNLAGALANLPMQFCAEVGEDDIRLFRQHLLNQTSMRPRIVEIPVRPGSRVTFDWKHSNLEQGYHEGWNAVKLLLQFDPELKKKHVSVASTSPAAAAPA